MNGEQFKAEIISYINNSYEQFTEYQKIIQEMFEVFHQVCVDNHICYYTAFGTLLGIVRDNGMIPWDADIDVMIPLSEAAQAIQLLSKKLPSEYYIISNYTDPNYYLYESRVCKKGYNSDVFHIDIFYMMGAPDTPIEQKKYSKAVRRAFYIRALRNQPVYIGSNKRDRLTFYAKKTIKTLLRVFPNAFVNWWCDSLIKRYDGKKCNYYSSWDSLAAIYPADCIFPGKCVRVENQDYCIPHNPKQMLEAVYHNYDCYMPVSDRYEEFYAGFKRFKKYEKKPENRGTALHGVSD